MLENSYTLRPWQEGDDLALLEIWHDAENPQVEAFRAALRPDGTEPWSRTLVAEHQGIPVAAGTIYETSLHNQRLWAYLEVAPEHRRRGLGHQLLTALQELAQDAPSGITALRTKALPGSDGLAFAEALGLKQIQRSRTVKILPGSFPPVPLQQDEAERDLQSIEDLATGSVELTQKVWDFYRRAHRWDPPAEVPLGYVNRTFLSEEADAFGALVLRDDIVRAKREGRKGNIIAFAISYKTLTEELAGSAQAEDHATELFLGYDFDYPGAREAIMQLLSVLAYQYPVVVEVDDSMEDLATMVDHLLKTGAAQLLSETLVLANG